MKKNELKIKLRSEEIFPNGFSLEDFEKFFEENQNIVKNNRNIIKKLRFGEIETVTKLITKALKQKIEADASTLKLIKSDSGVGKLPI